MDTAETLWADFKRPIANADDYLASLRGRRMNVFFMGERVPEPADHPVIRPSINAMAETFRLASERPELGTVPSEIAREAINRIPARADNPADLVVSTRCSASSVGAPAPASSAALGSTQSAPAIR